MSSPIETTYFIRLLDKTVLFAHLTSNIFQRYIDLLTLVCVYIYSLVLDLRPSSALRNNAIAHGTRTMVTRRVYLYHE
jgi:hypothetical protein